MTRSDLRSARLIRLGCVDYLEAWDLQRQVAAQVRSGDSEALILCSHPLVVTMGRRAEEEQLRVDRQRLEARGVRVVDTDRGGGATAHHPGQLVGYPILRLGPSPDLHRLLRSVETALIAALRCLGVEAERRAGLTGVWIGEEKIASIGMRFSGGVTSHGFALNVCGDLSIFDAIVPCGLAGVRMTSLERQGVGLFERRSLEDAVARAAGREFGLRFDAADHILPARAYALQ